ncbi:MAG: AEC family transporter [Oscillospiraceae bacterium]
MDALYLAFTVVFPLFCMMALGYFLRRIKIFNAELITQLNNIVFKVFLPIVLFLNVYQSDFKNEFSPRLVLFAVISISICFLVLMLLIPRIEKNDKRRGVMIQGIIRSNFVLFGLPVSASLLGAENVGTASILISFAVPLFNVYSVIALETYSDKKTKPLQIAKNVFKNPLILGALLGFAFVILGVRIPTLLEKTVGDIGKIATPLALIVLGGSFAFSNIKNSLRQLIITLCGRLVIIPIIFLPIAWCFGFGNLEMVALLAMFASPTAVSSYTMAESMGADHELAGNIVVFGSIAAIFTMFIWVTIYRYLGIV